MNGHMIESYKKLCEDGHFDIAIMILRRYNLQVSKYHSKCIIRYYNGQMHYDYCHQHNIPIDYTGIKLSIEIALGFFNRIIPHPEINTLEFDIDAKLYIMFPNITSKDISHKNAFETLQVILKDKLNFTAKEIFDHKYNIYCNTKFIDWEQFIIYIINNMNHNSVYNIMRALYEYNKNIFTKCNLPKRLISIIIIHKKTQFMPILDFFSSVLSMQIEYRVTIGLISRYDRYFSETKLIRKIFL